MTAIVQLNREINGRGKENGKIKIIKNAKR